MAQIVSNFLTNLGCPILKWPEKKSKFNMQALTRLQNHLNQVRFVGRYQRKGPFLKTVLMILKPNKVDWIIFLTFSGHSDLGLPTPVKKFEIWLNLSQGCVGLVFCVIQYLVYLNKSIIWIVWIRDMRWTQSNSTQPNPHYPIFHPFFLQISILLMIGLNLNPELWLAARNLEGKKRWKFQKFGLLVFWIYTF